MSTTTDLVTLRDDFTGVHELINRLCEACWIEYIIFLKSMSVLETNNKNDTGSGQFELNSTSLVQKKFLIRLPNYFINEHFYSFIQASCLSCA